MRAGADRTYRLSRISAAEVLPEPAQRSDRIDPGRVWQERSTRFRTGGDRIDVLVRVNPERREELLSTARPSATRSPARTDGYGWR